MQFIKPYFKYLYVPGVVLTVAGVVAGITSGSWSPVYLGIVAFGSLILVAWLVWLFSHHPTLFARRSTQAGTNALLSTVALLVILTVINLLAFRYSGKIDLTENQLFTLSPQTETVITQLKKPLKVWIFSSNPVASDKDLLKNYQRINSNFSFEFVNPDQQPGLVKDFNVKSQGEVFIQYGSKKQLAQTLINFNQPEPLSEIKLTNTIEKIQRDRILNVYFLQGHGEHPLNTSKEGVSEAVASLENKGFKVNPLNLVENAGIPDNTNAIVIAGPQREFLKAEVEVLKTYSDRGGNLMVLVDPEVNPGLDPLFQEWGIKLDPRTVVDLSGAGNLLGLGPAAPIITQYGEHPITKEFSNGISIFPLSRPIATVKTPDVQAVTLLQASPKMLAKKELTADLQFDEKQDLRGPFDLGVALERTAIPPQATTSPSASPIPNNNSPSPLASPFASPLVSPSASPLVSPSTNPSLSPSPSLPQPSLSPSFTPSPPLHPKPSIRSQRQSSLKLVSYTVAQTASPSLAPPIPLVSPPPSPSLSPSPSPLVSQSPRPSISPKAIAEKVTSKMVVIGNAMFMTNQWFNEQLNGDIFLNSVQWLANREEQSLAIRPKEAKNRRLTLTPLQASAINWLSLFIFPVLGISLGIFTWWRRR